MQAACRSTRLVTVLELTFAAVRRNSITLLTSYLTLECSRQVWYSQWGHMVTYITSVFSPIALSPVVSPSKVHVHYPLLSSPLVTRVELGGSYILYQEAFADVSFYFIQFCVECLHHLPAVRSDWCCCYCNQGKTRWERRQHQECLAADRVSACHIHLQLLWTRSKDSWKQHPKKLRHFYSVTQDWSPL